MIETLVHLLLAITLGLTVVLVLRHPVRHLFGVNAGLALWLLAPVLALAPLLPQKPVPAMAVTLPAWVVTTDAAMPTDTASFGSSSPWLALWLIGTLTVMVKLAQHYQRVHQAAQPGDASWVAAIRAIVPDIDSTRLRVHEAGPAILFALPRSLILLPADFETRFADPRTRQSILEHELTHLRRGDVWSSLAMELAFAVLWFHPLAWLARSRFRLDLELACDATAVHKSPHNAAHYARALLQAAAGSPLPTLTPWLSTSQLKERLMMITRKPISPVRHRIGLLTLSSLAAIALLFAGTLMAVSAAPQHGNDGSEPSVLESQVRPRYPVEAIREGRQGRVMLLVTVGADGVPSALEIDPGQTDAAASLQQATLAAVAQWRFKPARENGVAVAGKVRVPMDFTINELDEDGDEVPIP